MTKPVLVLGAGPAGLAAAHALASVGQRVVLVDKESKLGGAPILSGYAKLVPSGEWAKEAIGGMVSRAESDSRFICTVVNAAFSCCISPRSMLDWSSIDTERMFFSFL